MMGIQHSFRLMALFAFAFFATPAFAHKSSDAYLTLSLHDAELSGQWDIALRDLDFAIGVDANRDGEITWGEVKARRAEIDAYALARLAIDADGSACLMKISDRLIDAHSDGGYAVLRLAGTCEPTPRELHVNYRLFADIDPQHRGLLNLQFGERKQAAIFAPATALQTFSLAEPNFWRQFANYVASGIAHIWAGYDHILFLLSLLLPAALIMRSGAWEPREIFRDAFVDVVKIVTSFTIAHSLTLALATFQIVALPSRLTESAIAFSVALAALNNLHPVIRGERWLVAGAFGLVHGFGFATTLVELGLSSATLAIALAGFNVGVEIGQIAIVGVFLPLAWRLRETWLYRRAAFSGGSYCIAAIAILWFIERSFDLNFLPIH